MDPVDKNKNIPEEVDLKPGEMEKRGEILPASLDTICEKKAEELSDIRKQLSMTMDVLKKYETVVSNWNKRCRSVNSCDGGDVLHCMDSEAPSGGDKERRESRSRNEEGNMNEGVKGQRDVQIGRPNIATAIRSETNCHASTTEKIMGNESKERRVIDEEKSPRHRPSEAKGNVKENDKNRATKSSRCHMMGGPTSGNNESSEENSNFNDGNSDMSSEKYLKMEIPEKHTGIKSKLSSPHNSTVERGIEENVTKRSSAKENGNMHNEKDEEDWEKKNKDSKSVGDHLDIPPVLCETCLEKERSCKPRPLILSCISSKDGVGENSPVANGKADSRTFEPKKSSATSQENGSQRLYKTKVVYLNDGMKEMRKYGDRAEIRYPLRIEQLSALGLEGKNISLNAKQVRFSEETKDDFGLYDIEEVRGTGVFLDQYAHGGPESFRSHRDKPRKGARCKKQGKKRQAPTGDKSSPDGSFRFSFYDDESRDRTKVSQLHTKEMLIETPMIYNDGVKQVRNPEGTADGLCGWLENPPSSKFTSVSQDGNARPVQKTNRNYWFDINKSFVWDKQLPHFQPLQGIGNPPKRHKTKASKGKPVSDSKPTRDNASSNVSKDLHGNRSEINEQLKDDALGFSTREGHERPVLKPGIVKQQYFDLTELPETVVPKRGFKKLNPLKVAGKPIQATKGKAKDGKDGGKSQTMSEGLDNLIQDSLMRNSVVGESKENEGPIDQRSSPVRDILKPLPSPKQRVCGQQVNWSNKQVGRVKLPPLHLEYLSNPVEKQYIKSPSAKKNSSISDDVEPDTMNWGSNKEYGRKVLETNICMLGNKIESMENKFPPITKGIRQVKKTLPVSNVVPIDLVRIALKAKKFSHDYNDIGTALNNIEKFKTGPEDACVLSDLQNTRKSTHPAKKDRSYFANGKLWNDESLCNDDIVKEDLRLLRKELRGQFDEETETTFEWYTKFGEYLENVETDRSGNARPCSLSSSATSFILTY